ncbi:MAG: 3-deoxy-manno-octulosonate cytidylyltransferase [Acidobacteriaceae bacterium]|nr:3-deoxy-manno-octulosonate cytidylyltransferase [Acidobacteriaceae bacterium]
MRTPTLLPPSGKFYLIENKADKCPSTSANPNGKVRLAINQPSCVTESHVLHSVVRTRILGVIPARFASSRFPGKALASLAGKPMVQHVWERAQHSRYLDELLVATDDDRIANAVRQFGGRVRMTRAEHPSGTDRLAEVASAEPATLYVNIQGDEPLIDPEAIDAAILSVHGDENVSMGTLKKQIVDPTDIVNPNVVKVVTNLLGDAIYFSRCSIPYERDGRSSLPLYFKHIGLYVYRRDFLLHYPDLSVGPLEQAERLEQLRALENGYRIRVVETDYESLGVDTPEDLARVNDLFSAVAARLPKPHA